MPDPGVLVILGHTARHSVLPLQVSVTECTPATLANMIVQDPPFLASNPSDSPRHVAAAM